MGEAVEENKQEISPGKIVSFFFASSFFFLSPIEQRGTAS